MSNDNSDDWDVQETEPAEDEEQDVIGFEISYYPADYTLKGYLEKYDRGQLFVPEFQRSYVWDQVKASKLLESFLLGLPVPGVFLYKEKDTNRLQIVDGQQRILSAIRFFKNRFGEKIFRLRNVHPRWDGKTFEELSESDQYQLDDAVLRATVVQQLDPEDDSSIYHIFERLNTGGMNLNPMEIRKCVYFGEYYSHLENLNELEEWRDIIGKEHPDKRLRDVELVLRVIALMYECDTYEKPMKRFLNSYMSAKRKLPDKELSSRIESERADFNKTCMKVRHALGEKPFHLRKRLNYAALDSVMAAVHTNVEISDQELRTAFKDLIEDEEFLDASSKSTSDDAVLQLRFSRARHFVGLG